MRKIVIVMGKCGVGKQGFGIRFELRDDSTWCATWSFAIKDAVARKEGYESTRVEGRFSIDERFPGCPHCSSQNFFVCSCDRLSCMKPEALKVICPWCNQTCQVGGQATSISGGGDR
jgi:hypothetical protein